MRIYELYGCTRSGPFTNQSAAYSRGSHRWIARIRATSIRQAYALAYKRVFQPDPKSAGLVVLHNDWWHHGCLVEALRRGWITIAPHFGDDVHRALGIGVMGDELTQIAAMERTWRPNYGLPIVPMHNPALANHPQRT